MERSQLLRLAGVSVLASFVLMGLPFLARHGLLTDSSSLLIFSVLCVSAGISMIRSPEKHDVFLANQESISDFQTRWRRIGERLAGIGAIVIGLVLLYLALA